MSKCLAISPTGEECQEETEASYCPVHAPQYTAEIARIVGLRTMPKPGDVDYKEGDK